MRSNYDKHPFVTITSRSEDCDAGWNEIVGRLRSLQRGDGLVLCIECYPGVFEEEIEQALRDAFHSASILRTTEALKSVSEIDLLLAHDLPNDPVFGRLSSLELIDFFDPEKVNEFKCDLQPGGISFVLGTGAVLLSFHWDVLIYADLARWEIQQRQRHNQIGNLGAGNSSARASEKYRRAFFVDWRAADRLKKQLLPKLDFFLDTHQPNAPKMISGDLLRTVLA